MKDLYLKGVSTLKLDREMCVGCGACIDVCPHDVFRMGAGSAVIIDADLCMECGACKVNCPSGAISVNSGVGCATAIYYGMLNNTEPTCGCSEKGKDDGKGCCG